MAARLRIEYVTVGDGLRSNGQADHLLRQVLGSVAPVEVTSAPLAGGDRITVPTFAAELGQIFARCTALEADVIVTWGDDPTAGTTGADSLWLVTGTTDLIPVLEGTVISAREAPAAA